MTEMSLPALLESLGQDCVERLPGLQLHKKIRFMFSSPAWLPQFWPETTERSRPNRLLAGRFAQAASSAGDDAWTLVVDDLCARLYATAASGQGP